MAQQTPQRNPFMLLVQPEVVLAAVENSERLGQLNRHLCRPLDKVIPGSAETEASGRDLVTAEFDSDRDSEVEEP